MLGKNAHQIDRADRESRSKARAIDQVASGLPEETEAPLSTALVPIPQVLQDPTEGVARPSFVRAARAALPCE